MRRSKILPGIGIVVSVFFLTATRGLAQRSRANPDEEFGPVVRAYLGYLRNEQEVVDDRVSRREINPAYYRHNSNRIRALRQMAIRIARESGNDYLPELEAVTRDEFGRLFEHPPEPTAFKVGDILANTFRFLGVVRSTEMFFIFARLDPYEQAQAVQKAQASTSRKPLGNNASDQSTSKSATSARSRRVSPP